MWKLGNLINHCMPVTCEQAGKLELVSEGRDNPLHAAVRAGRSELIEVLLAAGARIDIRDDRCRGFPGG